MQHSSMVLNILISFIQLFWNKLWGIPTLTTPLYILVRLYEVHSIEWCHCHHIYRRVKGTFYWFYWILRLNLLFNFLVRDNLFSFQISSRSFFYQNQRNYNSKHCLIYFSCILDQRVNKFFSLGKRRNWCTIHFMIYFYIQRYSSQQYDHSYQYYAL